MGFMAGFGQAFSRSYEGGLERQHQEKQDAFRLTYQDYMNRQKQYDEWNREDAKYVKTAQDYEKQYGLPEGSWGQIYSWLKNGEDRGTVQEWIQKGSWSVDENVEGPAKPAQAGGIDAQMQESGMAQPSELPEATQPEQPERSGGLFSNLLGNLSQKGKQKSQSSFDRRQQGALEEVSRVTGRPMDEIQSTMSGYKPPVIPESNVRFTAPGPEREKDEFTDPRAAYIELAQARTAAESGNPGAQERYRVAQERVKALQDLEFMQAQTEAIAKGVSRSGQPVTLWDGENYTGSGRMIVNPDGTQEVLIPGQGRGVLPENITAIPITDDEVSAREKAFSKVSKQKETIDTQRSNARDMFTTINVMNETIRVTNGEVLKPMTAGVTSTVARWAIDAATMANKFSQAVSDPKNEGKQLADPGMLDQLVAAEKELLKYDKTDLAAQKLLFDTQKAILAYRIGMSMGQEGRGLAEAERKLFSEVATSGVTVDQFYNGMANLVMPIVKGIDNSGMNTLVKAGEDFKGQYGYVPGELSYTPLQEELNSGDTANIYQEFVRRDRSGSAQIIKTDQSGEPAKEALEKTIPTGAVEKLRANPDLAQKFNEKYGPGAAERVLGGK